MNDQFVNHNKVYCPHRGNLLKKIVNTKKKKKERKGKKENLSLEKFVLYNQP